MYYIKIKTVNITCEPNVLCDLFQIMQNISQNYAEYIMSFISNYATIVKTLYLFIYLRKMHKM